MIVKGEVGGAWGEVDEGIIGINGDGKNTIKINY